MRAHAETLKANTQEISALKAMDASKRSMLEVDAANRKVTIVFNALGSIGLEICKPRKSVHYTSFDKWEPSSCYDVL